MATLFAVVPTFGNPPSLYDFAVEDAVIAELDAAALGAWTGSGGTEGFSCFGYRVADELVAREALARAMAKHLPGTAYHVRVAGDSGCHTAFEVLREFTPKQLTLRRAGAQPLGSFEHVQTLLRRLFPGVQFGWTPSGPERIRVSEERGWPLTRELRQRLEKFRSELEGVIDGNGYRVRFGLGCEEPVACLQVTPLGDTAELARGLAALESAAGARFQESEEAGTAEPRRCT